MTVPGFLCKKDSVDKCNHWNYNVVTDVTTT